MDTQELLVEVEAFVAKHDMRESTFGRQAANDWKLIKTLREGRRLWPETTDRVRAFMREHTAQAAAPDQVAT